MSSEFLPINMQRRVSNEDTAYLRQNQYTNSSKAGKAAGAKLILPSNDEMNTKVNMALQAIKNNVFPERGSILNILV